MQSSRVGAEFDFLADGGEMGQRIRDFDWAATSLGTIAGWPQSLRTVLDILLRSASAIFVWWGPELVQFYNDAYRPILGRTKHPAALGNRGRETWAEIWGVIEPMIEAVMQRGESTRVRDGLLVLERNGFPEEGYFDYAYSPIHGESGQIAGIFAACNETTARVLAERRLQTLRALGATRPDAASARVAAAAAAQVLADNPSDIPFALIYLPAADGSLQLAATAGIGADDPRAAPQCWPLRQRLKLAAEATAGVAGLPGLPGGPWPEPAHSASVLPLHLAAQAAGAIVLGASPRLLHDDAYRAFHALVADQVAAGVASAQAAQAARQGAAHDRLRRLELETLMDAIPAAVLIARDPACQHLVGNRAAQQMLRLPPEGHPRRGVSDAPRAGYRVLVGDRLLRHAEMPMVRAAASGRAVTDVEARLVFPDGSTTDAIGSAMPLFDETGAVSGCIGVFVDISARRQRELERLAADAALRESEQKLRAIYDGTQVYIGLLAPDGTLLEANRASLEFGPSRHEDVVGLPFWDTVWFAHTPGARERVMASVLRAADGEAVKFETPLADPRGLQRTYEISLYPVRDANGQVGLIVPECRDVSERRAAETALQHADRMKDIFIATLAHELRNPLAPIANVVGVLRQRASLDAELAWCRDVLERQAAQMARLLDDLLDIARITSGKLALRRAEHDLGTLIDRAVEIARPSLDAGAHTLAVDLPAQPVLIDGDLARLAQVLSNLLGNAAKYTESGGRISLGAALEGDTVRLAVRDTGIGIASEDLPRVFELFGQIDSAQARAQGGLGIGLSLVKHLVELHGGTVEAASEGLGRGSEFSIRLPRVRAGDTAALPSAEVPPPVAPAAKLCVLVADDLRDGADSLGALLQMMGYEVHVAYDGERALALAERHRPAVALLDLGMPGLNGYEVCRRLREQPWGRQMLIVAQTGWGQEDDRRRTREAGFDQHLVKPVDLGALVSLLESR